MASIYCQDLNLYFLTVLLPWSLSKISRQDQTCLPWSATRLSNSDLSCGKKNAVKKFLGKDMYLNIENQKKILQAL